MMGFVDFIPVILAASEMGDIDLGLPEFRDDSSERDDESDEDHEPDDDG